MDVLKEQLQNLVEATDKEREDMQLQTLEMTKDLRERAEKLTAENEALGEHRAAELGSQVTPENRVVTGPSLLYPQPRDSLIWRTSRKTRIRW